MSLINKMLQDLDARRVEASGKSDYAGQVRAVPLHRTDRRPWWLVLALSVILLAVLAWMLLRPMPAVQTPQTPQIPQAKLPLRLDNDIGVPATPAPASQPGNSQPVAPDARDTTSTAAAVQPEAVAAPRMAPEEQKEKQKAGKQADKPLPVAEKSPVAAKPAPATPPENAKQPATTPHAMKTAEADRPAASARSIPETASQPAIEKQIKELSPQQKAENEFRKAMPLIQQGRTAEAIAGLELALQLDPLNGAARQALVGVLLDTKRTDDAMRRTREGLLLEPAQPNLAMILARLQVEKGELKPAIETLQRALPYAADQAEYLAFLAALLQRDGRNGEAIERYLQALQRSPQNGVWWMGLGISMQAEGHRAEALEAFSRAKSSNSLSPELLAFVESKLKQLQR